MAEHVVRAERVVPARSHQVWQLVASCAMLQTWLFRVDGAGEWSTKNGDPESGHPIEGVSLFDTIAEYRWITYRDGRGTQTVVVRVQQQIENHHIEWVDEMIYGRNGEVIPTRSTCNFRISLEPSAGETRVRLRLQRSPRSFIESVRFWFSQKSMETALNESLLMLDELVRYNPA